MTAMQKRIMWFAILILAICNKIAAEDKVYISDFSISPGETKQVSVILDNEDAYVGFQFDVYLPEGFSITSCTKSDRIPDGTNVLGNQRTDDTGSFYRVIGASLAGNAITGTSGDAIATLTVTADASVALNDYTGYLRNIKVSKSNGTGSTKDEESFTITVIDANAEPYAVLSDDNKTLTFYYDSQKASRSNVMSIGPFASGSDQSWYSQRTYITTVEFDVSFANYTNLTSTAYWFIGCHNLSEITGIENLKTDNVTSMASMFSNCINLGWVDLRNFKTGNVTDMSNMFINCSKMNYIGANNFDTKNVKDMSGMFYGCTNLSGLDVSGFDTGNVTTMKEMFRDCSSLSTLDISNFNTAKVTTMLGMFFGCSHLRALEFGNNFVTSKVQSMSMMFAGCKYLETLDLSNFDTSSVLGMYNMFESCRWLETLDLSSFNTANVLDMTAMFLDCANLETINLSSFNTAKVKNMVSMFKDCTSLTTITVSSEWNTASVTDNGEDMFSGCTELEGGSGTPYEASHINKEYARIDEGTANPGYLTGPTPEPYAVLTDNDDVITDAAAFIGSVKGKTLTFFYDTNKKDSDYEIVAFNSKEDRGWNDESKNITRVVFDDSFAQCTTLTSTANWFNNFQYLRTITDIYNLNTDNVTNMECMFYYCSAIRELDVSHFNTSKVTNMAGMFWICSNLKSLDVRNFNTENVTNMWYMFSSCSKLTSLDLTNFNTKNVTNMGCMFYYCPGLKELDISNFKTDNVTHMNRMFCACDGLTTIYVGNKWSTARVTDSSDMFSGCTNLKGGAGTECSEEHVNADYARIDGGPESETPGYFTRGTAPEPYAVLSSDSKTLTFYYNDQKEASDGMDVGPFSSDVAREWHDQRENITTVIFDNSFANYTSLTSTAFWFEGCSNLISIENISNLKTDNVTNMFGMFSGCSSLTEVDLSGFNTDNVTNMFGMFTDCSGLTSLNVSRFNTENVTIMDDMFSGCSSLKELDVSGFNTENVTIMRFMFYGCSGLTSLDVSRFDTKNVTSMTSMFQGCSGLTSLDMSGFNTVNVTYMTSMFSGCSSLKELDVSGFNTTNAKHMGGMFWGCSGLSSLDVSRFNTDNVTDMSQMFYGCSSLTSLDLSSFNTSKLKYDEYDGTYEMGTMFSGCSALTTIYVGEGWNVENLTMSTNVFKDCTALVGGAGTHYDPNHTDTEYARIDGGPESETPGYFSEKVPEPYAVLTDDDVTIDGTTDKGKKLTFYYDKNKGTNGMDIGPFDISNLSSWYDQRESITNVVFDESFANYTNLTSTEYWFSDCLNLKTIIGIENLKTDSVKNMRAMFSSCSRLTSLDLSSFNTDSVTNMAGMFYNCSSLTNLKISSFYTANVTNMNSMFEGCRNLTSLDVSGFKTGNVTTMESMFSGCSGLKTLDVSKFDTKQVTNMKNMFFGCSGLESLNVSKFETSNVETMLAMFRECSNLKSLDVSNFNTSKVGRMSEMFYGCEKLTSLDLSKLDTKNVNEMIGMFSGCSSLESLNLGGAFCTDSLEYMSNMFAGCSSLKSLDLSGFNTAKAKNMINMFGSCSSLNSLDLSSFDTKNVTLMTYMFQNCSELTTILVGNDWNTDAVTESADMFNGCTNLVGGAGTKYDAKYIDKAYAHIDGGTSDPGYLSKKDPEPYALLSSDGKTLTFYYDKNKGTTGMDIGPFESGSERGWDQQKDYITKVVFDSSFAQYTGLTSTYSWFDQCSNLTTIEGLNNLNTENVEDMGCMFEECRSLKSIDLSNFNTTKVDYFGLMFADCSSLTSLDLSGFVTNKATNMFAMFGNCSSLTTIYVGSGWNTDAVTDGNEMFNGCTALVGGAGTEYDADNIDKDYAHIDGGASDPGYLTDKNKKIVTITATSCSREYGDANPAFEYTVVGATLSGEPTITCEATATSPVGTYPIEITYTAEDASKMDLTYVNGTLTITKAPLTITAKSYTIKRGEPIPTLYMEYSGFKNNETDTVFTKRPTASTVAKSDTIPGNYDITVLGAEANNYEMKYVNGTLTITDDVTVTAKSYSRAYGDTNPTFEFTSEGATLDGTPTITCEATATSPVGTYDIVIAKGSISNSTVTYVNGTMTITKAPLTITAKSYSIKQGKPLPTFEVEYSGLKNNETDTVFTTKPTVSTSATSNSEPGTYDITVSGAEANNYEMNYVNGTLTITESTETFDGIVLTVNKGGNMDDAFESYGGREEAGKTIAAIIWNADEQLTNKMLEGFNNPNLLVYVSEASKAPEGTKNLVVDGKAKEIVLVDAEGNNNFFAPQEFTAESISYSRTFKQATQDSVSRGWEGICLPFNVQTFTHEKHGEISPFGNTSCDYHFWLRQPTSAGMKSANSIEANKPYIISMPNSDEYEEEFNHPGLLKFTSANVTVPVTEMESVWLGDSAQIVPTFVNIETAPDIYTLNVGDSIQNYTEGSIFISNYRSVRPFEVYTIHEPRGNETEFSGSRIISLASLFGGNDDSTGVIDMMKTVELNGEVWYDMNGRRLQSKPSRKGVYIKNGKKVVVK